MPVTRHPLLGQVDGVVAGSAADIERLTCGQRRVGAVALDEVLEALRQWDDHPTERIRTGTGT
jgi:hypothetical protein